jgi:hypothetical protein
MKRLLLVVGMIVAVAYGWMNQGQQATPDTPQSTRSSDGLLNTVASLRSGVPLAFASRKSDVQVTGKGEVVKVLPDDNKGSRHQRFILRVGEGLTVLVAHNIDLAPKISGLGRGDAVAFSGEYEWNAKGGVIHWTHHDPKGRHIGGWLKHNGRTYQ